MPDRERGPALVALAVLGLVLLNYPILAIADVEGTVLGIPVLWAYLFMVWAAFVAAAALLVRRGSR